MERHLTFSESWIKKPFNVRRSLIEHDLWLSVLGSGLVLLTFIYKDAKRDDAKDLMSALGAATSQFVVRTDLHNAQTETDLILHSTGEIQNSLDRNASKTNSKTPFLITRMIEDQPSIGSLRARLDLLQDLAEKIPCSKEYVDKVNKLIIDWDALTPRFDVVQQEYDFKNPETSAVNTKAVNDFNKAEKGLLELGQATAKLEEELIKRAKATAKLEEEQYERYTKISNWTFGIGWFLGLVGKVAGVPKQLSSNE